MTFSFTFIFYPFTVELDIWSWSTIWHIMHLIYELYFNIYVEMCLFDVVVTLDVKKIEKKMFILYFLMQNDICRYFSIFSPLLPISFILDPRRYIRRHDICNYGFYCTDYLFKFICKFLSYMLMLKIQHLQLHRTVEILSVKIALPEC